MAPKTQSAATPQRGPHRSGTSSFARNQREMARAMDDEKQMDERVIYVNRVARAVKGGRRFRFQALVVAGDHKGRIGVGVSKGADVSAAVIKATEVAKKSAVKISLYKTTLTHDVQGQVGGAKIMIMPASPGTGLIAGGVVRTVLEVAGIENALSKSFGSSNRVNTTYATIEALRSMQPVSKWVIKPQPPKAGKAVKKAGAKA
jgi:small subunit ribosomal protein S5